MSALSTLTDEKQLALIRRTVAKDCDPAEFDQFIHMCRAVRLDPLRRQIYAFVFHKGDPRKRQMTVVTSIGGYRSIAERTGNYRPGATEVIIDPDVASPATNPRGISHAIATVYKHSHGEWHPITETAYWDEFAPIKEIWDNGEPSGRFVLDPKKDGWRRMPRVMIEKCAEAKALRRAWPDDFAALMVEDEMDRAHALDLTASELAAQGDATRKLELVGGKDALTVDWCDGSQLSRVPDGKFAEAFLSFASRKDITAMEARAVWHRNLAARTEFKARHGSDYLSLQREYEALTERKEADEIKQAASTEAAE